VSVASGALHFALCSWSSPSTSTGLHCWPRSKWIKRRSRDRSNFLVCPGMWLLCAFLPQRRAIVSWNRFSVGSKVFFFGGGDF
jgi:hypothetical protein